MAGVVFMGGAYLFIQRDGNFHTVEARRVYRSAQPNGDELRKMVVTHGIKTVLNLRGENPGTPWYDDEMRTARAMSIQHLDVRMSAYQVLSVQQMDKIVGLIDRAPKPLLIHCESGADRTGLVSALYRLSRGQPAAVAAQELAPQYGHVTALVPRSAAMDRSFLVYLQDRRVTTLAVQ
jgi:protein tyrosine/serine phosphatase